MGGWRWCGGGEGGLERKRGWGGESPPEKT